MTRDELKVNFAGLTHDHLMVCKRDVAQANSVTINSPSQENNQNHVSALSTIAILRRHPMYDSLVLVKRYRACINGYTLEFPTTGATTTTTTTTNNKSQSKTTNQDCCKTKLVSVYLDGDDPIYQCEEKESKNCLNSEGEIVHVPMNGLLTRLDNYDRLGVSIDSRVYAFAMGLKTAEKFLTTSSMKEIQETPPL